MRDEEELSEEEIQRQQEQKEQYEFKRTIQKLSLSTIERYNSLKAKEKQEDEELAQYMLDIN